MASTSLVTRPIVIFLVCGVVALLGLSWGVDGGPMALKKSGPHAAAGAEAGAGVGRWRRWAAANPLDPLGVLKSPIVIENPPAVASIPGANNPISAAGPILPFSMPAPFAGVPSVPFGVANTNETSTAPSPSPNPIPVVPSLIQVVQ